MSERNSRGPKYIYVVEYRGTYPSGGTVVGWVVARNRREAISGQTVNGYGSECSQFKFSVRRYAAEPHLMVLR